MVSGGMNGSFFFAPYIQNNISPEIAVSLSKVHEKPQDTTTATKCWARGPNGPNLNFHL